MKLRIFLILLIGFALAACTKEEPELNLVITPSTFNADAGEPINFAIEGRSEFLVFYSGLEGARYDEYPDATARSVNMLAERPSFSFAYNYHGSTKAVFVATSYGNWGEDKLEKIFEFDFEISDNNTGLQAATLKTPGLFGQEYEGVIDASKSTVTATIPQGNIDLAKLTTNLVASSTRATILLDGQPFENKTQVDFSSGPRTFVVKAIGGAEQNWVVQVERE